MKYILYLDNNITVSSSFYLEYRDMCISKKPGESVSVKIHVALLERGSALPCAQIYYNMVSYVYSIAFIQFFLR